MKVNGCHAVAEAFCSVLLTNVVNENDELKKQIDSYLSASCSHSHDNKTWTTGELWSGQLNSSLVHDHILLSVEQTNIEDMMFGDFNHLEITAGGVEIISQCEASTLFVESDMTRSEERRVRFDK